MLNLKKSTKKINHFIWDSDIRSIPVWQAWIINSLRILHEVFRDLTKGQLNLQAMSLVYTTLLSLVPLLAVSFSMLKGFGVHNQIEPFMLNLLAPLGDKGHEITAKIIDFVDNVNVGVLGSVGLGVLLYTTVSLIYKIEKVFNFTWE